MPMQQMPAPARPKSYRLAVHPTLEIEHPAGPRYAVEFCCSQCIPFRYLLCQHRAGPDFLRRYRPTNNKRIVTNCNCIRHRNILPQAIEIIGYFCPPRIAEWCARAIGLDFPRHPWHTPVTMPKVRPAACLACRRTRTCGNVAERGPPGFNIHRVLCNIL